MNRLFPKPDCYLRGDRRMDVAVNTARIADVPDALNGLTIAFAADIHLRSCMDAAWITSMIADLRTDLILLGGDYADTKPQALRLFDAFRSLRAPLGIFAVRGNNDIESFGKREKALASAMGAFGATLLVNRSVGLLNGALEIGGVDDHKRGAPCAKHIFPAQKNAYRILMSHQPIAADCPHDLMLAGHTHGGQFNFFGLTPYCIGFEHNHLLRVSGFDGRTLVNKGIGTSRIHLRVGVRPEIHRIIFGKC